jgi:hypothetical protein
MLLGEGSMGSCQITLSIEDATYGLLQHGGRTAGQSPDELAGALVEEGRRMQRHPGIVFRSGPAGRRASLIEGPDVWEVARVLRVLDWDDAGKRSLAERLTGLKPAKLETARRYYLDYSSEVDARLQRVDNEAEAAFAQC